MKSAAKSPGQTVEQGYTERLLGLQSVWWKRWLNVQAPYAWNLKRLQPGYTLDIGCGVGRNLKHIGGHGVGLDHNAHSVAACREMGFKAYLPDEFRASPEGRPASFDTLLVAHVLEHMTYEQAVALIEEYRSFLKPNGRIIVITPQEAGYQSDPTHVVFVDFAGLDRVAQAVGLRLTRRFSFPFPRAVGRVFKYNEFVAVLDQPVPATKALERPARAMG